MLEFVEVSLGHGTQLGCGRCHAREEASYRRAFEIAAEVEAACAAWGGVSGPNVALGGPEPFGHAELPDLVADAVRAGVKRLRLDTDAVALGHPDNAAGVLAAGVRHLRVTLLGGSDALHDALAGTPGLFARSLEGMRSFGDAARRADVDVSISARVPVCHHNVHEAGEAVSAAASGGARHVLLDVVDGGLDPATAMRWIAAACDTGTVNRVWVEVAGMPYCLAGSHALHLVPVMRPVVVGAKSERCEACAVDASCGGLPAEAVPQARAMLAPPAQERLLEENIRRAYLAPTGPGELE